MLKSQLAETFSALLVATLEKNIHFPKRLNRNICKNNSQKDMRKKE